MDDLEVLNNVAPLLQENLHEIYVNGKIGVESNPIKILFPKYVRKFLSEEEKFYCDHIIMEVPFAGKVLQWDVFFNREDYNSAPDFDFNDNQFLSDPTVDIITEQIPSMVNWNLKNPKALLSIINELLSLYKKLQLEQLEQENIFAGLYASYQMLLTDNIVSEEDIELYIENYSIVHFLISLKVDFSGLPPYLQPKTAQTENKILNPYVDSAVLKLTFLQLDGSRVQVNLDPSPRLAQVLGDNSTLNLPAFSCEMGLNDYVSEICSLFKKRIEHISMLHKLKSKYMYSLLVRQGHSMIEYDDIQFSKAIFLCEVNSFYCLVIVNIGKKFPEEKPNVILQSIHHMQVCKPITDILNFCQYSPRWKPEEMVTRLIKDLIDAIPKFQKSCRIKIQN